MIQSYSNFIDVRSSGTGKEYKKVFVKGYASMPNKADLYNFIKTPEGKTRTFKSIFTDKCIADMKKQMQARPIFVDGMHTIAADMGIKGLAKKYGFNDDDMHDLDSALKMKKLPLAKLTEFDIDDNGLIVGTETNPYFAEVDQDHANYYKAVTGSLLDRYLKGFSINFDPIEFKTETDANGNQMDYIDKVNMYGISYTDHQALPENEFTEVCMRSLNNFMKVRQMEDVNEKQSTEDAKQKAEAPKTEATKTETKPSVDVEAEVQKRVAEELKKKEVETQQKSMQEQLAEVQNQMKELRESKETKETQQQSTVTPENKYGAGQQHEAGHQEGFELKTVQDKIKEITAQHDAYMAEVRKPTSPSDQLGLRQVYVGEPLHGFGELIQLQNDLKSHMVRKPNESETDYHNRVAALQSGNADMSIKLPKKEY